MPEDRSVCGHGKKGFGHPRRTAENKGINQAKSGAGFPEYEKDQKNQNADQSDGPQFLLPFFQKALLGR